MFNIGGEKIMSIIGVLELNHQVSLKPSVYWEEGSYESSPLQPRLFLDGEVYHVYYAPTACKDNPVYMPSTPIGDKNWRPLPKDFKTSQNKPQFNKLFQSGDKLSPDDIEVGMIVDVLTGSCCYKECTILLLKHDFVSFETPDFEGAVFNYERFRNNRSIKFLFRGYSENITVSSTDNTSSLSEQSIAEAIKTLAQAAQELQTMVAVNADDELTIYSHYHEKELTFNLDSLDQLVQYVECVKKLDKFKD